MSVGSRRYHARPPLIPEGRPIRAIRLVLSLSACVTVATGCGTIGNTMGPRQYPHVYGGVEFDYLALRGTWSASETEGRPLERFGRNVLWTGLIAIDLPLCLVCDTLTLPEVLMRSGFRGWDAFPSRSPDVRTADGNETPASGTDSACPEDAAGI